MKRNASAGTPVIVVTLIVAAWLDVLPMADAVDLLRPQWMLLAMIYWAIALPHRIGVVWGALVGLSQDVLLGSVLGQHALAMTLAVYIAQSTHRRLRVFPPLQQSAVIFLLVGVAVIVSYLVQDFAGRAQLPPMSMMLSAVVSAVFWRSVYSALRWTRRRFLVR